MAETAVNGPAWKFKGGAAIYRNLTSAIARYQVMPGKPIPQAKNTAVGFKFRTGPKPVYVYGAGRVFTGNSKGAHMAILRASDNGGTQTVTDATTNAPTRFYRLNVITPQ